MARRVSGLIAVALMLAALVTAAPAVRQTQPVTTTPQTFAQRVAALSEPGGYFNTDNLISNERSYLHVIPAIRALSPQAARTGAYIGVGPDQNFSYIAHLRPSMAILVDIRRDNLLLHLLFKALFAESRTRVEYLALLTGRPLPEPLAGWEQKPLDAIIGYIDSAKPLTPQAANALRVRLAQKVKTFGVSMTDAERAKVDGFHTQFITSGLSLRFNTTGRAPQFDYPTYRDLLIEVDRQGARQSFIATEDSFQFVKSLQARDLVIPVTGDLGGTTALASIARFLNESNHQVSAFYTSNVEFYLFRDGSFPNFMTNLARLPRQSGSVIIRSVFPSGGASTAFVAGYNSASLTQPIQTLVDGYAKGQFRQYGELVR